jgi:hypothetical protein
LNGCVKPTGGLAALALANLLTTFAPAQQGSEALRLPDERFGAIVDRFRDYDVVLRPDRDEAEWWAGGPSVVRDEAGTFWMATRMRMADAPLGQRGYEIRILKSIDGIHFERAHALRREEVPLPGFERPALIRDATTGKFKLYACGRLPKGDRGAESPWCVFKFDDAAQPDQFDPKTARPVIEPREQDQRTADQIVGTYSRDAPAPEGYKDPVIVQADGRFHAFVIGVQRSTERTYHFISDDGEAWQPVGGWSRPMLDLVGWHNFAVRPASVLPVGVGYLFIYEGSHTTWPDPVYNIATGLGFTFDLDHVHDLTPDRPLLESTTPGRLRTWRYSHWLWVGEQLWVYAEVEKPNGAHEVRLFRVER